MKATTFHYLLLAISLLFAGCSRGPIPDAEKRKDFGDAFIYQGAPFCCIYVGLETNEVALFSSDFWHFADQHGIHKPRKHYVAYSGPPLATCKSDHVSVFVFTTPTTNIITRHEQSGGASANPTSWQAGIWMDAYWPSNACRLTNDGKEVIAPMTGTVRLASNDTNYPIQEFKQLSAALTATLQSAFPDRAVRVFSYDGDKQSVSRQ